MELPEAAGSYEGGPEGVTLRFPPSMLQVLEVFGSQFFVYDSDKRAYVGRAAVAPEICRLIADGDANKGRQIQLQVEKAYAEYIAVPTSFTQLQAKPIP